MNKIIKKIDSILFILFPDHEDGDVIIHMTVLFGGIALALLCAYFGNQ